MSFTTIWTMDNIKEGLERFFKENGRHPISNEIDNCLYLPSSRHIQRAFGGLQNLRKNLGYEISHYGKGDMRAKKAYGINIKSIETEKEIEVLLISIFGEYFVHIEKPLSKHIVNHINMSKTKIRCDFYVYASDRIFCVDVFYPVNFYSWTRSIDIKLRNYRYVDLCSYLVNMNERADITSEKINHYIKSKKERIPDHIKLLNKTDFIIKMQNEAPIKTFY